MIQTGDDDASRHEVDRAAAEDARVRAREIAAMSVRLREVTGVSIEDSVAARAASRRLLEALRGAVGDYARCMRRLGTSREQAVTATQEILASVTGQTVIPPASDFESRVTALQVDMVRWTVEAYGRQSPFPIA